MYSSEYNADNWRDEGICYSTSVLPCGIKGRYFHVAWIEVVGWKYGKPPDEQEHANEVQSHHDKAAKRGNEHDWKQYTKKQDLD